MIPNRQFQYLTLSRIPTRFLEKRGTFWEQTPVVIGPRVDLVHTFNQLPFNRTFVVSAEMELPRYLRGAKPWQSRFGLQLLASDRCRGIWPLSEAARRFLASRFGEAGHDHLIGKLTVFRGAVLPPANERSRVSGQWGDRLNLLFVGGDGLRKGLGPTIQASHLLRRSGLDVRLTVVGQPSPTTYVVPGEVFPVEQIRAALSGHDWITHYPSAPNAEVRRLMGIHDLLVLPTMDESLGWVFAEAGITGLPAVTTNVFAIPEMVIHGRTGWVIDLPLGPDQRWARIGQLGNRNAWDAAQEYLKTSLLRTLSAIAEDRRSMEDFGVRAHTHIATLYGLEVAASKLEALYKHALN